MSLQVLVDKYIASAEKILEKMQTTKPEQAIDAQAPKVVQHAKSYLSDAKYYRDHGRLETSLASIAYCEGLLDALRLLGVAQFEWPTKPAQRKEE